MKLNLGSGSNTLVGFLNVDKDAACNPDLVFDLESFPWPWQDSSVDEFLFSFSLEQMGKTRETQQQIWSELYRVAQSDARVRFVIRHPRHDGFIIDPNNIRPLLPESFLKLDQVRSFSETLQNTFDFDILKDSLSYIFTPEITRALAAGSLAQQELGMLLSRQNNIAESFSFELVVKKPYRRQRTLSPKRDLPHVLFVTEEEEGYYFRYNAQGSLEASELATHETFFLDGFFKRHGRTGDEALIAECLRLQPDLIVFHLFELNGIDGPLSTTLAFLKDVGIPMMAFWTDSDSYRLPVISKLARYGVVSVLLDGAMVFAEHPAWLSMFPAWSPYDTRLFRDHGLERDIDICFAGSLEGGHSDRQKYIEALRATGFAVATVGSNTDIAKRVSIEEYVRTLNRSKISLNFSKSGPGQGYSVVKGRVFESLLCGALLFEQDGPETRKILVDGKEYVAFASPEDLIAKARYYLERPYERESIARAGQARYHAQFAPEHYWRKIFERMKVR